MTVVGTLTAATIESATGDRGMHIVRVVLIVAVVATVLGGLAYFGETKDTLARSLRHQRRLSPTPLLFAFLGVALAIWYLIATR